jgi:hypothetical protein
MEKGRRVIIVGKGSFFFGASCWSPEVSQGQGAPRLGRFVAACESGERDNNLERFELFEREVVGGKGLNLCSIICWCRRNNMCKRD